jgi:hypothetical protein
MNPRPLTVSASHLATVRGLRELHRLTLEGRQDSPEADAVRDATDAPWRALTEVEKRRIGGLSEDLQIHGRSRAISACAPRRAGSAAEQTTMSDFDVVTGRSRGVPTQS